jgi:L-amino acid N-acyltransferase YncA
VPHLGGRRLVPRGAGGLESAAMADADFLKSFDREITVSSGARVRIRPIRPDDEPRLVELYGRLSRHTAYQRFFSVMRRLPPDWAHFLANVDHATRFALVVERETVSGVELVAVARYEPTAEPGTVEVAFVVLDGWQGQGLGTLLLRDLLRAAEASGHHRFRAWVLADNRRMLDLLARHTDIHRRAVAQGVVELDFTARTPPPREARRTGA